LNQKKVKIIRDVVHGYIPLTASDISIIDTPHFQRLKRIRQTGASSVYPSANHTRFEHSLGVMHLGTRVINALDIAPELQERLRNTVRYACLLHDIGHAPFSHIGENFYSQKELQEQIKRSLQNVGCDSTNFSGKGAKHELCSCAIALDEYAQLLKENDVDLDLFCRMITGEKYSVSGKETENCIIGILNSGVDVDKLDYVLRDSFMSGADLISIDLSRLISAYSIYDNTLAFSGKALSTISNLIHGRNALYMWIYNHHITVYTDSLLRRLIKYLTNKSPDAWESLFSYNAISKKLVDDYDLIGFVRQNKKGGFSERIYEQLFNRRYYKPLWKTVFDFESIVNSSVRQDKLIATVGQYRGEDPGLEMLEQRLINNCNDLEVGDFYIAVAQYKPFNPSVDNSVYIVLNNQIQRFQQIFQNSIYIKPYSELPYIFVKDNKVRDILIDKINSGELA